VLLLFNSCNHRYCIIQNTLTDYLERIDCTIEELYKEVREAQSESTDPFLKTFIDCLLASADYESFYKVIVH
jgi:The ARF-like 2 binding protein BART